MTPDDQRLVYYLERAEELREIARTCCDLACQRELLLIADKYDELAKIVSRGSNAKD